MTRDIKMITPLSKKVYIVTGSSSYDEHEIEKVFENPGHAQAYIAHLEKRNDVAEKNGERPWEPTYLFRPSYEISECNVDMVDFRRP